MILPTFTITVRAVTTAIQDMSVIKKRKIATGGGTEISHAQTEHTVPKVGVIPGIIGAPT